MVKIAALNLIKLMSKMSLDEHLQKINYHTCAIITRGLYTFYPLFEVQKRFLRGFFLKILALCMVGHGGLYRWRENSLPWVSIQERFLIKSGL